MFDILSNNPNLLNSLEFLLKLFGGIGAFYLFLDGLKRYSKDQTWKRNEFVAERAKEFNSDKMVRNTMHMLDWGKRYIELFPEEPYQKDKYAKVTRKILKSALQSHKLKPRFTKVEVAIRDNFDCFLNYFEVFEQYIEADLIASKELEPYLKYWINTISDEIELDVKNTIHHYINEYGFKGTQILFKRFGKDILPKTLLDSTKFNEEEEIDTSELENEIDDYDQQ
jgi:transketolase